MHDHGAGLPRRIPGTILYLIETESSDKPREPNTEDAKTTQPNIESFLNNNNINAATKGGKKGDNGCK